jgi:hypothetical protein
MDLNKDCDQKEVSTMGESKDSKPSAQSARISFSKEHTSKSNPEPHVDVYRQLSNEAKPEKIAHNPTPENKVSINKHK